MSNCVDFETTTNERWFNTLRVQDFLNSFDYYEWHEIDEDDREQIERARALKEAVTGDAATDEDFESNGVTLVRENEFVDFIKQEEIERNEDAWKNMPRVWQDNIDWSEVASELRSGYAEIEWEGNTYLYDTSGL